MADGVIDQPARDKAGEALHAVQNFRAVAEQQFKMLDQKIDTKTVETNTKIDGTNSKIDEIKSALKWAGGLIVSLILTVLGWAVAQQLNSNEAQKKDMQQQIQLLQQQERARVDARNEILSRLPSATSAGATEATAAASRRREAGDQP